MQHLLEKRQDDVMVEEETSFAAAVGLRSSLMKEPDTRSDARCVSTLAAAEVRETTVLSPSLLLLDASMKADASACSSVRYTARVCSWQDTDQKPSFVWVTTKRCMLAAPL